jgi:myo-inositol-1-phosphate synthase
VGNCASSLVQGVEYYKNAEAGDVIPGLMHPVLGGYHIRDINFTAAFDVDIDKVGKDLRGDLRRPEQHLQVHRRPRDRREVSARHDPRRHRQVPLEVITKAPGETADIVKILKETEHRRRHQLPARRKRGGHEVVRGAGAAGRLRLHQLHPGLHRQGGVLGSSASRSETCRSSATTSRARSAPPSSTACSPPVPGPRRPHRPHLPAELRRQHGLHEHARARAAGVQEDLQDQRRHQPDRLRDGGDVHVGPSDYVPWLQDRKWCHIRIEGTTFGDVPLNVEMKLEVWDSPNSAGVVIDAVRAPRSALDRGIGGPDLRGLRVLHEVAAAPDAGRGMAWRRSSRSRRCVSARASSMNRM